MLWVDTKLPTNLQVITINLLIRRDQLIHGPLVSPGNLPACVALPHNVPVQTVWTGDRVYDRREMRTGRGDVLVA